MIPKNIIYIWFGRGEKSELVKQCINKNHTLLEEWNFAEYTEDNYDISTCRYLKEAYDAKKYAFASDFARFDILYKHGGIYVDTDVEFIKKIPTEFLEYPGFSGVESNQKIAPGLIFACEAGNSIVKEILDSYKADTFLKENGEYNLLTVVDRVTQIFEQHGFECNGKLQNIEGIRIYPYDYFCAFDFITRDFMITENTLSIHHYAATWISRKDKTIRNIKNLISRILGKDIYRSIVLIKRKLFGVHK